MFTLDRVVPWGRSFDEYRLMFDLSEKELALRVLGCADGPSNFNAVVTRRRANVISCDPLYRLEADQIRERIAATYDKIMAQTRKHAHQFVWKAIPSITHLGELRMTAMNDFLNDYPRGKTQGRYVAAQLPALPFADRSFDLALCSHFLFLYSAQLDERFHRAAVQEMCRAAKECRIFPLLALDGRRSPYVQPVLNAAKEFGFAVSIENVSYEFQRGGNQMMRICRPTTRSIPAGPPDGHANV